MPVGSSRAGGDTEAVGQTHWDTNAPVHIAWCYISTVIAQGGSELLRTLSFLLGKPVTKPVLSLLEKSVVTSRSCDLLSAPASACVFAFFGGWGCDKVSISCLRAPFQMGDGVSCRFQEGYFCLNRASGPPTCIDASPSAQSSVLPC